MNELNRETALREVLIKAVPVNDNDDLDALLGGEILAEKEIAEMASTLLDDFDDLSNPDNFLGDFASDWLADRDQPIGNDNSELIADRLKQELEDLRSQHQFECEYVDQLEQEVISINSDRDRQVTELTIQLEQAQTESNEKSDLINQLQAKNRALDISQQNLTQELANNQQLLKESTHALEIAEVELLKVKPHRDQIEEDLIQHLSNQAKLHQSLRGLENEYVSDLTRVQDSQQQIEELQEQILRQASKAAEYEAAIQHWKEQSVRHQHHALQLSGALDRLLDEKPVKHLTQVSPDQSSELISDVAYLIDSERSLEVRQNAIPNASSNALPNANSGRSPRSKVDLPSFLVNHR